MSFGPRFTYLPKHNFCQLGPRIITYINEKFYRARAINTQLGKEENSPFFKLKVTGDPNAEVAPTIVVKPEDTKIIKDQGSVEETSLNCIANARYFIYDIFLPSSS